MGTVLIPLVLKGMDGWGWSDAQLREGARKWAARTGHIVGNFRQPTGHGVDDHGGVKPTQSASRAKT